MTDLCEGSSFYFCRQVVPNAVVEENFFHSGSAW